MWSLTQFVHYGVPAASYTCMFSEFPSAGSAGTTFVLIDAGNYAC